MMQDIEATVKADPLFTPARQLEMRTRLGLEESKMKEFIGKTKFFSLGSFCGVAQALQTLGLRGAAGPFDWMRSRCEGVTHLLDTNFEDFLTREPAFQQSCGSKVFPMKWGGSYWHHDISKPEVQEAMLRRKERFQSCADENIIFIRAVNDTDELKAIPKLVQSLKACFANSHVRLLVLLDHQDLANEAVMRDLGKDVVFSLVTGAVWEAPLAIPPSHPEHMRTRMKLEGDAYALSLSKALRIWMGSGTFSLFPSLEHYRSFVAPFTSPDPKQDGFRGRRLRPVLAPKHVILKAATQMEAPVKLRQPVQWRQPAKWQLPVHWQLPMQSRQPVQLQQVPRGPHVLTTPIRHMVRV